MVLFSTGYIFTDGEKSEYPGYFISLDRNSGLMLWRIPLDGESWTGISVNGDIAYLGTLSGSIYAIDLADSNLYDSDPSLRILWKYNTDRAIAGPIFVESNHIIVGDFGNRIMKILPDARKDNLDFPTKSEWIFDTKNWVWAELISDRGVLYAATLSGDIHAIDNLLGTEIWSVNLGDQVVASPAIFERARGDFREKVLAVPSGDKNISIISVIDGRQLGTLVTRAPIKSSPLIIGETLYTQNTDGQILWFSTLDLSERGCIDLEEGNRC
jgi:outer membrane protein assembly factor BamB